MQTVKISIEIKDNKKRTKKVQWVRLESPTEEQLHQAKQLFHSMATREGINISKQLKAIIKSRKDGQLAKQTHH